MKETSEPSNSSAEAQSEVPEEQQNGDLPENLGLLGPREAAELITKVSPEKAVAALRRMLPTQAQDILGYLPASYQVGLLSVAPAELVRQLEVDK